MRLGILVAGWIMAFAAGVTMVYAAWELFLAVRVHNWAGDWFATLWRVGLLAGMIAGIVVLLNPAAFWVGAAIFFGFAVAYWPAKIFAMNRYARQHPEDLSG